MQETLNRYTSTDLAKKVEIAPSTARKWIHEYKVPQTSKNGNGHPVYGDDVLQVFETIKQLKNDNRSNDTIQRTIAPAIAVPEQPQASTEQTHGTDTQQPSTDIAPTQQLDIRAEIKAALIESTDLAEKYARATYTIGQLEERVAGYQAQLESKENRVAELEQQVKLLPDVTDVAVLQHRLAHAEQMLAESKHELEAEKKKTWWQKFLGK